MPTPYADRPRLKSEIVNWLWNGYALTDVAALPGMPGVNTIRGWARQDPQFRQAIRQGAGQGRTLRREARATWGDLSPAQEAAIVAALRDGAQLQALYRRPGWPSYHYVCRWRRRNPAFDAAVRAALAAAPPRPRPRAWAAYDEAAADRIILRLHKGETMPAVLADPTLPGRKALNRWRRMRPDFARALRLAQRAGNIARGRAMTTFTEAQAAAIVADVQAGHSLRSLSKQPGMPRANTMYYWAQTRPAFAAALRAACAARAALLEDLALDRRTGMDAAEQAKALAEAGLVARRVSALRPWPGEKAARRGGGAGGGSGG